MRRLTLLLCLCLPLLTSCSASLFGSRVLYIPDPLPLTYVEFDGTDNPCQHRTIVSENLGSGATAELWRGQGVFRLHGAGNIVRAYFEYDLGYQPDRRPSRSNRHRYDGQPAPIYGPKWEWSVPNASDNGTRTMRVTVVYRNEGQPEHTWVGEYSIYNTNMRDRCPGSPRR